MLPLSILTATLLASVPAPGLQVTLIGNEGVLLTDGATSLLVDLPYEPGAFNYQMYDPSALRPAGTVVSVITHHHRDHFDRGLFLARDGWRIVGPPSVTDSLPTSRVIRGDSLQLGAFSVVVVPTRHTLDHRSYRVRWGSTVLHFVGDTDDPTHLTAGPPIDILFITPWLSCAATPTQLTVAVRRIVYHLSTTGRDRICGDIERLAQGTSFAVIGDDG